MTDGNETRPRHEHPACFEAPSHQTRADIENALPVYGIARPYFPSDDSKKVTPVE